ncbi:MFS transporter [bacterium]|nr:MFS transporter [bacterium]
MALSLIYKNHNFGLLWLAQFVSFVGDGVFQIGMVWWLVNKTHSGTLLGLIMSVSFIPAVILGPFAGTLADRAPPKRLLISSDLIRAALLLLFAWISHQDKLEVWHLFVLTGLLSASGIFYSPTTLTVIPRVVTPERIDEAMALHAIIRDLSKLLGPTAGGALMIWFSVADVFMIDAFSFLFSAICILIMRIEKHSCSQTQEGIFSQLMEGFAYVRKETILFDVLIGFSLLNLFAVPILVLIPIMIADVFHRGSVELGMCEGALSLGSVLAGLGFDYFFKGVPLSRLLVRTLGFSGFLFLGFAIIPNFYVFLGGLLCLGGCFITVNVGILTLFQQVVAPEMKGRFFSLVETISSALFPITLALAGFSADKIGVAETLAICGIGTFILTFRFAKIKGLSTLDLSKTPKSGGG